MTAERVKKTFADFDDLVSKTDDINVQFLIRAIKMHAELTSARLTDVEERLIALQKK